MQKMFARPLFITLLIGSSLAAWSPEFHEAQTARAMKLLPKAMTSFLAANARDLMAGARGQSNDQVPTVEDVEDQFRLVVSLTEEHKRPERVVKALGVLAHQVQLLMDPSVIQGVTPLRELFQAYGDEKLRKLALTREPFWAVSAPLDPRPHLLQWAKTKFERNQALQPSVDETTGRRIGGWDELSVPYAQLQLAYSGGINATANLWIQLWRAVGNQWDVQPDENVARN